MSNLTPRNELNAPCAEEKAGILPQLVLAAGIIGVFRGLALIVSTFNAMLWPVVIVFALVLFVGCGLIYGFMARRVAQGKRTALIVIVVASIFLLVPSLLHILYIDEMVSDFESARGPSGSMLLNRLLFGSYIVASALHTALLVWIIFAGIRLRKKLFIP